MCQDRVEKKLESRSKSKDKFQEMSIYLYNLL